LEEKVKNRKWVSELAFGQEMEVWNYKGIYPLEVISLVVCEDNEGVFYYPIIKSYTDGGELISGYKTGFSSRSLALEYVGKCWDLTFLHSK
jgi:hypothetical protein